MDLSKLPRLSETGKQASGESGMPGGAGGVPPNPAPTSTDGYSEPDYYSRAVPVGNAGGDAWINIAIGVITLLMYPRFLQWVASRLFGSHFNEFVLGDGVTIVSYPSVPAFWADLGPTSFGIMLIVEGLATMLSRRTSVLWAAFGLTVLVTGYNLIYLIITYSSQGLAVVSALTVVFGIYIAKRQWQMLRFA